MADQQRLETSKNPVVQTANVDDGIDLIELMYRLLAGWKLILCLTLVFALGAGVYTEFFVTPLYEATSTIYVVNRSDSAINFSDLQIGTALTPDYIKVFKMWEVHEAVITNLSLPYSYTQMKNMLTINNDSSTRMLDIKVTSPNPEEAAAISNEYAEVASWFIAETMSTDKPNIMSVALVPTAPVSPSVTRNAMLGFMLGFVIACGYITIKMLFDDKYKTAEDIAKYTGLTTLAVVPVDQPEKKKKSSRSR